MTTTVELIEWRRYVEPHCRNVSPLELIFAVRQAAVEFCQRTGCWQVDDSSLVLEADQAIYALPLPTDTPAVLHQLREVWIDERRMELVDLAYMKRFWGVDWETEDNTGTPNTVLGWGQDSFRVFPVPTQVDVDGTNNEGVIRTVFTLRPDENAEELPPFLFDYHATDIAKGAIEILQSTPGKDYSNMQVSEINAMRFKQAVVRARIKYAKSNAQSTARVRTRVI